MELCLTCAIQSNKLHFLLLVGAQMYMFTFSQNIISYYSDILQMFQNTDTCMQGHWSDISKFSTDHNACIFGLPIFWKFNSSVCQIISTSVLEAYSYRINWFHVFSQNKNSCQDKLL
jgi:hypothetical protein